MRTKQNKTENFFLNLKNRYKIIQNNKKKI